MGRYVQRSEFASISTGLGDDELLLGALRGTERLSSLFHFEAELWSEKETIEASAIVGQPVTVTIKLDTEKTRYIHGIVRRFSGCGQHGELWHYRAEIVPWLWFLSLPTDSRIFQAEGQTVPDIIEKVLKAHQCTDYRKSDIKGAYPSLDYCIQYQESPFAFVSRLMESVGIHYYFEHAEDKHTLVLADNNKTFKDGIVPELSYLHSAQSRVMREPHVYSWEHAYDCSLGNWSVSDAEPIKFFAGKNETPAKLLLQQAKAAKSHSGPFALEHYVYPGRHETTDGGKLRAKVLMEAEHAGTHLIHATSTVPFIASGNQFTLKDHPTAAENDKKYVVTSLTHRLSVEPMIRMIRPSAPAPAPQAGESKAAAGPPVATNTPVGWSESSPYTNEFVCIPAETAFRAAPVTPRPSVQSTLTAVVVGPKDEEIHTDKYGRVKIQFYWDREGKRDESGLCWVRVAQPLAGNGWGGQFIPRIGQEVVVSFLNGDPDRPLVTGAVYNGENLPPFSLPESQTQSGFKTQSTTKGDAKTFNALVFEDKKGSEKISFHAEQDFERTVENNDTLKVGFDKKDSGDQKIEIFNNQALTIGTKDASDGSQTITVWKDRTITLTKGNDGLTVNEGDRTVKVSKGNDSLTISKGTRTVSVETGDDTWNIKKGNHAINVDAGDQKITVKSGNVELKTTAGKTTITAGQEILLKAGSSSIKIDASGVTIKGAMVKIQASGAFNAAGATSTVSGGMLTLKGGIVKIN
ncbi:MAG: type VI secretion system Vgr family protein [Planctomycetales bacterium]|jgi:type VI secretion system secreted protein VgrG